MDQPVIHPNIQQFSRRSLLRRMALVAAAGGVAPLLSACGADTTPSAASTTGGRIGGAIDFLGWEGYNLPDLMKSFDTSHGINFRNTFISTSDDVQAKLMSGASVGYDLTNYYQGYYSLYRQLGIITPIDESKLPNLKYVDDYFKTSDVAKQFWVVDGVRYAVPSPGAPPHATTSRTRPSPPNRGPTCSRTSSRARSAGCRTRADR